LHAGVSALQHANAGRFEQSAGVPGLLGGGCTGPVLTHSRSHAARSAAASRLHALHCALLAWQHMRPGSWLQFTTGLPGLLGGGCTGPALAHSRSHCSWEARALSVHALHSGVSALQHANEGRCEQSAGGGG
jgi:hypothetical protein